MKNLFLALCWLSLYSASLGQDLLYQDREANNLNFTGAVITHPIPPDSNGQFAIVIADSRRIIFQKFDSTFHQIQHASFNRGRIRFRTLLASALTADTLHLYYANSNKSQLQISSFGLDSKEQMIQVLDIKFKGEMMIDVISHQNKLYLLSNLRGTSILRIRELAGLKIVREATLDYSQYQFGDTGEPTLHDAFIYGNFARPDRWALERIDIRNPNPLDLTGAANKLYHSGDTISITIDVGVHKTTVIQIRLSDFSHSIHSFTFPNTGCIKDVNGVAINSYLYKDMLFQVIACHNAMHITIHDFFQKKLLNEFHVSKKEEITFKNTPIIQDGGLGMFNAKSHKEIGKTQELLRKISSGTVGISAYPHKGAYQILVGGFKQVNPSPSGGIDIAVGNASIPYYANYTSFVFKAYSQSRSVYFKSLLATQDLQHIPGKIQPNAFDKLHRFKLKHQRDIEAEILIKVGSFFLFGYYDASQKKYVLRKFED